MKLFGRNTAVFFLFWTKNYYNLYFKILIIKTLNYIIANFEVQILKFVFV